MHHGGQHVFAAHEAAVEQDQAGGGHHEHKRGADEHPGIIAGVHAQAGEAGILGQFFKPGDALLVRRSARSAGGLQSVCALAQQEQSHEGHKNTNPELVR